MRISGTKLRQIIRRVLSESRGDGLSDPEVRAAYEELADMGFPDNVDRSDFAVDADLSFLDKWPYSEALDIMMAEGSYDDFPNPEDTDAERYAELEAGVRARQNRGMYETFRRIIREFGEKEHELRQKLANREKMIGRGIDGGTIGYNPNWDYDKRPAGTKPKFRAGDVLAQVGHVLEDLASKDAMMEHFEWKPSRNPDVAHIVSGGMTVVVKNNRGEFTFKMQKPHAWLGWERKCDSVDSQIEDILYDLHDYIDEKENG